MDYGFTAAPDGSVTLACSPEHEARAFEQFLRDGFERLAEVTVPVFVGYGNVSALPSSEWAPRIADALPAGIPDCHEGADHFGCFLDLDRVATSISTWFQADPR